MQRWIPIPAALTALAAAASGQTLTLEFRDVALLGDTSVDQHGNGFTVAGMSGLAHAGGTRYRAVMDNSDKLVDIDVVVAPDGTVQSAVLGAGLTLADTMDFEGIALRTDGASAYLSDELGPGVFRYSLADGALLETLPVPPVFAARRDNKGFEGLAHAAGSLELWTANEEALTVDGDVATPTAGTVVRLQHYDLAGPTPVADVQYAYIVEPMHGPYAPGGEGQSGLVELVPLPCGKLLAVERALAWTDPIFLTRVFELEPTGATEVSGWSSLAGGGFTPVTKHLLWAGPAANLEGLCLGPRLASGGRLLIGVVDDDGALNLNAVVTFELFGADAPCACTAVPYCTTSPNSQGPGARIDWSGSTSVAANDLVLAVADAIPGQFGLFLYGDVRNNVPVGDGTLCVGGGLVRLPVLQLDGAGAAALALDLGQLPPMGPIGPGDVRQFQFWYRDPTFGTGSNLSDALEIRFCE